MNSTAVKIARLVFDALSEADKDSIYAWMSKQVTKPKQRLTAVQVDHAARWWLAKLESGHVLPDAGWPTTLLIEDLGDDYVECMKRKHYSRRGNVTAMGRFLVKVGAKEEKESSIKVGGKRGRRRLYHLYPLDVCRAAFEDKYGPQAWSAQEGVEGAVEGPDGA